MPHRQSGAGSPGPRLGQVPRARGAAQSLRAEPRHLASVPPHAARNLLQQALAEGATRLLPGSKPTMSRGVPRAREGTDSRKP